MEESEIDKIFKEGNITFDEDTVVLILSALLDNKDLFKRVVQDKDKMSQEVTYQAVAALFERFYENFEKFCGSMIVIANMIEENNIDNIANDIDVKGITVKDVIAKTNREKIVNLVQYIHRVRKTLY